MPKLCRQINHIIQIKLMSQEKSSIKKSVLSVSDKRDLMWNFTEPGDPYDIRKSMIAKLPGEQKFMGPHLELVCLLQAAEIERLCQFLEEYRMKFRENERVQLDRHSYEVQIRELTERLSEEQLSRTEIEKLREFIRRQSIELEELQRQKQGVDIGRNYDDSLRQIAELKQSNVRAGVEIRSLQEKLQGVEEQRGREAEGYRLELQRKGTQLLQQQQKYRQSAARWQSERQRLQRQLQLGEQNVRKGRELEGEVKTLRKDNQRMNLELVKTQQLSHTISEYESRFQLLAEEIDRLNNVLREKSRELNEEYARSRQLSQVLQQREEEMTDYLAKIRQLQTTNANLLKEHRETLTSLSNFEQTKSLTQSYEASLEKLSIEVDRLNTVLRKKINELQEARRRNNEYEIKVRNLESIERECGDYKMRYSEVSKKLSEDEKELAKALQENDRLNFTIKRLIGQLNSYQLKFKSHEKEMENLQKTIEILSQEIQHQRDGKGQLSSQLNTVLNENESLKFTISRNEESKRIYDTKIGQYLGEIKKLQRDLEHKEGEVESIKSSKSETELRIREIESINQNDQEYIEELLTKNQGLYEENQRLIGIIENSKQDKPAPSLIDQNQLISKQYEEINRLNNILGDKDKELRKLSQTNEQLRSAVSGSNWKASRQTERQSQIGQSPSHLYPSTSSQYTSGQKQPGNTLNLDQQRQIAALQEQLQSLQMSLISKQQTMRYYVSDNERYYTENAQLKNNLQQRELRIERLQNEIDRIQGILGQKSLRTVDNQELSDDAVRYQIEYEVLKEKYELLVDENNSNILKAHNLQEEMIKLQYKLTQSVRSPEEAKSRPTFDQRPPLSKKSSKSGDILEESKIDRDVQFLKERCDYLTEENEKYRIKIFSLEEEREKMHEELEYQARASEIRGSPTRDLNPFKPIHMENYQQDYESLVERYNNLAFSFEKIQRENNDLKDQNRLLSAKKTQAPIQSSQENTQLQKKNNQIAQYFNKILLFSQQIERLNNILSAKDREAKEKDTIIADYHQKLQGSQVRLRDLSSELQRIMTDPRMLSQDERRKLIEQNQNLQQRVTSLEFSIRQAETNNIRYRSEFDSKRKMFESKTEVIEKEVLRLNDILAVKIEEIRVLEEKNRALNQESEQSRMKKRALNDYETKIAIMGQQIERLNGQIKLKEENYRILEQEYQRCQAQYLARFNQTSLDLRKAQDDNDRLSSQLSELKNRDHIKSLQIQSLNEYELKIMQLSNQIERLNRILYSNKQRIEQLQPLQEKETRYLAEIERLNNSLRLKVEESFMFEIKERSFNSDREALNKQIAELRRDQDALEAKYRQAEEEGYASKRNLLEYQKRINELYLQFDRLQKIITGFKKEIEEKTFQNNSLIEKNQFLGKEIERLNGLLQRQGEELSDLRARWADDDSLQRRIKQDLSLFVVLFAEIQALRDRVRAQQAEIEEVRRQNVAARLV